MTPDQQKELDELLVDIRHMKIEAHNFYDADMCLANLVDYKEVMNAAQAYADHFEMIKAIESGEWLLMPVEPTDDMIEEATQVCDGYASAWYVRLYKAMQAAKPKIGKAGE